METKPIPNLAPSDIARFWSHVDVGEPDACWPWKVSRIADGYGQFKVSGQSVRAHRVAFVLFHGYDPIGRLVRHTCDYPPCCNGAHLIDGDEADNAADCVSRGRNNPASGSRHGSRTHPESRARGERVGGSKLTTEQVTEIRSLYLTGQHTHQSIADRFGVKRETVGVILRGERWAHVPFDREAVQRIGGINQGKPGVTHHKAKLTEEHIREIRARHSSGNVSYRQLATDYGVTAENIAAIVQRRTWRHVT